MLFKITKQERRALTTLSVLIVLGIIALWVL